MAGGSADAAAALRGLNELFEMGYSVEELNNPASEASQNLATLTDFAKEMGAKPLFLQHRRQKP